MTIMSQDEEDGPLTVVQGRPRAGENGGGSGTFVTVNPGGPLSDRPLFADDDDDGPARGDEDPHPPGCRCDTCTRHPRGCRCNECIRPRQRRPTRAQITQGHMRDDGDVMLDEQPLSRHDMRDMHVSSPTQHYKKVSKTLLGIAVIFICIYAYNSGLAPEPLPRFQFTIRSPGHELPKSSALTEQEIVEGLIQDVPVSRVLLDLKTHLLLNDSLTCICMHHLDGFISPPGRPFDRRRLCAVINLPSQQVDFLANPRVVGQSHGGTAFSELSLACDPRTSTHTSVVRPVELWVEWDGLVPDAKQPVNQKLLLFTRRFSRAQAACLALSIEEMDGKPRCGAVNNAATPPSMQQKSDL